MPLSPEQFAVRLPALEPRVRAVIGKQVGDANDAADLCQDTFSDALTHLADLREPAKLEAWVKAIARNKVRHYFQARRDRRWHDLVEQAESPVARTREHAFEEFDGMIRRLAAAGVTGATMTTLVLHFCFGWTPREISATSTDKIGTVYGHIARAKRRLRAGAPPAIDPEKDAYIKQDAILAMWRAALYPVAGTQARNRELMDLVYAFTRLACLQSPRNQNLCSLELMISYSTAHLSQYRDDEPVLLESDFRNWRRDQWDPRYRAVGEAAYRRFQTLDDRSYRAMFMEAMYRLYSPLRHEDVDWRRIKSLLQEALRMQPQGTLYLVLARVLAETDGPSAAARYMEEVRKNPHMRDNPLYYLQLAKLYFRAGNWAAARRGFRKFLKWPRNAVWRGQVQRMIQDCTTRLAKRK